MTISAKVILDSVAPNGARLTTFELTYPRFIHCELMTHRVFSRNAASSRAIPTPKKIARIREDVARPSEWGVNQKGMVASGPLDGHSAKKAQSIWDAACEEALSYAEMLCGSTCANCGYDHAIECHGCTQELRLDLHKQVANRILEPFDHITVVLSTTKLKNHFLLRLALDGNGRPLPAPTYFELATKWKAAWDASVPHQLEVGEWHLPYVSSDAGGARVWVSEEDREAIRAFGKPEDGFVDVAKKISAGRCARVSYLRQGQGDVEENVKLHDRLTSGGHWAPLEHVATPIGGFEFAEFEEYGSCYWCLEGMNVGAPGVLREYGDGSTHILICMRCANGHIHSGNFHGWRQYRKEFAGEAGGE